MQKIKFILILLSICLWTEKGYSQPSFRANPIEISFSIWDCTQNDKVDFFTKDSINILSRDKKYSIQIIRGYYSYNDSKEFNYIGFYKIGTNITYNESVNLVDKNSIKLSLWRTNHSHRITLLKIRSSEGFMVICIDNLLEVKGAENITNIYDYMIYFKPGFYEIVYTDSLDLKKMNPEDILIFKNIEY